MTNQPERWRRYWDKHARKYDKEMAFWDRVAFGDPRVAARRTAPPDQGD